MIPKDTDLQTDRIFKEMIMSKSPEERFRMGLEMVDDGWALMIAGIKYLHPGYNEKQINIEILKRLRLADPDLAWLGPITDPHS